MYMCVAPAKINLALHIVGQRIDGYHLLESLVAFTEFGDRLNIVKSDEDSFFVTGPYANHVPADETNLILRVKHLLTERYLTADSVTPISITLEKNLPVASGIGGGSSDAAAAINLLAQIWDLPIDQATKAGLAMELGADIPMCLTPQPLIARGIGEETEAVSLPSLPIVLVNPGKPLSTPSVFKALKNKQNSPLLPLPQSGFKSSSSNEPTLIDWLKSVRNDLEQPSIKLVPEIRTVLKSLADQDPLLTRMSGSGATCFALFDNQSAADHAASQIAIANPSWFIISTRTIPTVGAVTHDHP